MRALSCGQTPPLWYDIGLYRASVAASVRIPQPEKNSGGHQAARDPLGSLGGGDAAE